MTTTELLTRLTRALAGLNGRTTDLSALTTSQCPIAWRECCDKAEPNNTCVHCHSLRKLLFLLPDEITFCLLSSFPNKRLEVFGGLKEDEQLAILGKCGNPLLRGLMASLIADRKVDKGIAELTEILSDVSIGDLVQVLERRLEEEGNKEKKVTVSGVAEDIDEQVSISPQALLALVKKVPLSGMDSEEANELAEAILAKILPDGLARALRRLLGSSS